MIYPELPHRESGYIFLIRWLKIEGVTVMPVVSMTIPDVEQAIVRPALIDIIHQIEDIVHISKDTRIMFPGDIMVNQTTKTSIDDLNDRSAVFTNDRYLYVEVDHNYNEDQIASTPVHMREHNPVFVDPELLVSVWPIYLSTQYTINFKYVTPSKTEAVRWRDDIYARITQMRDINMHDITYHYQIPKPLWELLTVIHTHKSRIDDSDWQHYINSHASPRLSLLTDITGKNQALAISEKQTRILGQFDFSPVPEKIERDDSGVWTCSFGYRITFEKPAMIGMRYPIMVCNRILPAKYVTHVSSYDDENKHRYRRSRSMDALSFFETSSQIDYMSNIYVPYRIPEFDELKASRYMAGYMPALSVLTELDETDRKTMFSIDDLDPYAFDVDVLEFIRESEYPYIHHGYQSAIHIGLYKNYQFSSDRMLTCDSDLNIVAAKELSLTNPYHVVFSLITDLTYLKESAIERLRKYPKVFVKIIGYINEMYRDHPELKKLADKPRVTEIDFERFFKQVMGRTSRTGHIWNSIKKNQIGFKRQQLSRVISMPNHLL